MTDAQHFDWRKSGNYEGILMNIEKTKQTNNIKKNKIFISKENRVVCKGKVSWFTPWLNWKWCFHDHH